MEINRDTLFVSGELTKRFLGYSEDRLATAHLLIASFLEVQFCEVFKKPDDPFFKVYLKHTTDFLKDSLLKTKPQKTSFDGTLATYALTRMISPILELSGSESSNFFLILFTILDNVMDNYHLIIGNKSFREYFNDIFFDNGEIISLKASDLTQEAIHQMQEDLEEQYGDSLGVNGIQKKINHYLEGLNSTLAQLKKVNYEEGLVYLALTLELCRKILFPKDYVKFQKAVIKAIGAYKDNSNKNLKRLTFNSSIDAYEKLRVDVIERICQKYANGEEGSSQREIFSLAADISFSELSKLDHEKTSSILGHLSIQRDKLSVGETLQKDCDSYYKSAEKEYKELLGMINPEEYLKEREESKKITNTEKSDSNPDASKSSSPMRTSKRNPTLEDDLKEIQRAIKNLEIEQDIFLHAITLKMIYAQCVPEDIYEPYLKIVERLLKAQTEKSNDSSISDIEIDSLRKMADTAFENAYISLMTKMMHHSFSKDDKDGAIEIVGFLFCTSTMVHALDGIPQIDPDSLKEALKDLNFNKNLPPYVFDAADAYSLRFTSLFTDLYEGLK